MLGTAVALCGLRDVGHYPGYPLGVDTVSIGYVHFI